MYTTHRGEAPRDADYILELFEYDTKRERMMLGNDIAQSSQQPASCLAPSVDFQWNQDLLCNGKRFLKGCHYKTQNEQEGGRKANGEQTEGRDAEYTSDRYFSDFSTVRCKACGELGHKKVTCPNADVERLLCIYCAEKSHNQYSCPNKMCFRCNAKGHKSSECHNRKLASCFSCGEPGHLAADCVIQPAPLSLADIQSMVCMHCDRPGHVACTDRKPPYTVRWEIYTPELFMSSPPPKSEDHSSLSPIQVPSEGEKQSRSINGILNEDNKLFDRTVAATPKEELTSPSKRPLLTEPQECANERKRKINEELESQSRVIFCCYCGENHSSILCLNKPPAPPKSHDAMRQRLSFRPSKPAFSSASRYFKSTRSDSSSDSDCIHGRPCDYRNDRHHHDRHDRHHDLAHHRSHEHKRRYGDDREHDREDKHECKEDRILGRDQDRNRDWYKEKEREHKHSRQQDTGHDSAHGQRDKRSHNPHSPRAAGKLRGQEQGREMLTQLSEETEDPFLIRQQESLQVRVQGRPGDREKERTKNPPSSFRHPVGEAQLQYLTTPHTSVQQTKRQKHDQDYSTL